MSISRKLKRTLTQALKRQESLAQAKSPRLGEIANREYCEVLRDLT